jgi:hypothetical protein
LTAKTCRGTKRVPDALVGAGQLRETTPTENIGPPGSLGVGRKADNPTSGGKNIFTKSEEVKTGLICQGRHCKGLKDLRVEDIRMLGVKHWKKVPLNRDEWAKLLKKARAHLGLSRQ